MTKKTIAFILVGGAVAAASVGMVACSDSTTSNNPGPDGSSADTSPAGDSASADTSSPTDAGSEAAACKDPALHADPAGTIFCGYSEGGTGPAFSCTTGQQCCLGGSLGSTFAPEMCATFGGVCDNPAPNKGIAIECGQTADCKANDAGTVCCLQGAGVPAQIAGCSAADLKSSGGTAIKCEQGSACGMPSTDLQICATQAECGDGGKVCTPFHWKLYSLGYCK